MLLRVAAYQPLRRSCGRVGGGNLASGLVPRDRNDPPDPLSSCPRLGTKAPSPRHRFPALGHTARQGIPDANMGGLCASGPTVNTTADIDALQRGPVWHRSLSGDPPRSAADRPCSFQKLPPLGVSSPQSRSTTRAQGWTKGSTSGRTDRIRIRDKGYVVDYRDNKIRWGYKGGRYV